MHVSLTYAASGQQNYIPISIKDQSSNYAGSALPLPQYAYVKLRKDSIESNFEMVHPFLNNPILRRANVY